MQSSKIAFFLETYFIKRVEPPISPKRLVWEDDDKVSSSSDTSDAEVLSNVTSLWGGIYPFYNLPSCEDLQRFYFLWKS